jgi:DNA (cytosine-5)-methyltransferase 1
MMAEELLAAPRPDLLTGGTPCQGFSVAGLRKGLDDDRSNLCLRYVQLANALAPRVVIWENVPGVLSMPDNAFGAFVGGLVGADAALDRPAGVKRWPDAGMAAGPERTAAWRVLDAQYFGVAQRRNRVFLVASPGDVGVASDTGAVRRGRDGVSPLPAALLLEPEGVPRDTPPRREAGKEIAPTLSARTQGGGGRGTDTELDGGLIAMPEVSVTLAGSQDPHAASQMTYLPEVSYAVPQIVSWQQNSMDGKGTLGVDEDTQVLRPVGTNPDAQMIAFDTTQVTNVANYSQPKDGEPCHPLAAGAHAPAIAFQPRLARNGRGNMGDVVNAESGTTGKGDAVPCVAIQERACCENPLAGPDGKGWKDDGTAYTLEARPVPQAIAHGWQVRRLTPRECDRLQGFPDDWGLVPGPAGKPMSDSQRYKQAGNAVNGNVSTWIAQRLAKLWPWENTL